MKKQTTSIRVTAFFLSCLIFLSSCASTTLIRSEPRGATLFINGEKVGTTPYQHTDTKIVGSTNHVVLKKEGYEDFVTVFSRDEEADVGAIIGGIFFLFPFLWTMKYKPEHSYEMTPLFDSPAIEADTPGSVEKPKSKADELRELKELLDEKIITKEEFEEGKKKILERDE